MQTKQACILLQSLLSTHLSNDVNLVQQLPHALQVLRRDHLIFFCDANHSINSSGSESSTVMRKWIQRVNSLLISKESSLKWGSVLLLCETFRQANLLTLIGNYGYWLSEIYKILKRQEESIVHSSAAIGIGILVKRLVPNVELRREITSIHLPKLLPIVVSLLLSRKKHSQAFSENTSLVQEQILCSLLSCCRACPNAFKLVYGILLQHLFKLLDSEEIRVVSLSAKLISVAPAVLATDRVSTSSSNHSVNSNDLERIQDKENTENSFQAIWTRLLGMILNTMNIFLDYVMEGKEIPEKKKKKKILPITESNVNQRKRKSIGIDEDHRSVIQGESIREFEETNLAFKDASQEKRIDMETSAKVSYKEVNNAGLTKGSIIFEEEHIYFPAVSIHSRNACTVLRRRFHALSNCFVQLMRESILSPMNDQPRVSCPIPMEIIISLITRIYSIDPEDLITTINWPGCSFLEPVDRFHLLTAFHSCSLEILNSILRVSGRKIILFAKPFASLLENALDYSTTKAAQVQICSVIRRFIDSLGPNCSVRSLYSNIPFCESITFAMLRLISEREPHCALRMKQLRQYSVNRKASDGNKNLGEISTEVNIANENIRIASLKVLKSLILNCGALLQSRSLMDRCIVDKLHCNELVSKFSTEYRYQLLKCLFVSLLVPSSSQPTCLLHALPLFSKGRRDINEKISRLCIEGLSLCETIMHPQCPPVVLHKTPISLAIPQTSQSAIILNKLSNIQKNQEVSNMWKSNNEMISHGMNDQQQQEQQQQQQQQFPILNSNSHRTIIAGSTSTSSITKTTINSYSDSEIKSSTGINGETNEDLIKNIAGGDNDNNKLNNDKQIHNFQCAVNDLLPTIDFREEERETEEKKDAFDDSMIPDILDELPDADDDDVI